VNFYKESGASDMGTNVTYEQFYQWIEQAEEEAKNNPEKYKRKVGLFAALGYIFVFTLIAIVLVCIAGLVAFILLRNGSGGGAFWIAKLGTFLVVFCWMLITALWIKFPPPEGKRITRQDYPEVFLELDDLQNKLDTIPIHEVILINDLNAFVVQTPRLGILGWHKNTLALGLELMLVLDREEMRAVIAHELGHLSGNHSKFSGWIYRVRQTWSNLIDKFEEKSSWGKIIIKKFFFWYVPRFDAYSFALRRQNEFEADAASAELTNAHVTARALLKVNVFATYLKQFYWDKFFKQADLDPIPEKMAYAGFAKALKNLDLPEDDLNKIQLNAIEVETDYEDTHPALRDRLATLNMSEYKLDFGKLDFSNSSAHIWFGNRFNEVLDIYDKEWWENNKVGWASQFDNVQTEKKELKSLQEMNQDDLSQEDLWRLGSRTSRYVGDAEALQIFLSYQRRYPEDYDGTMVVGRFLCKMDDEACLREWKKIPPIHKTYRDAFGEASYFLEQKGRKDEAKLWHDKALERHQELENFYAEQESFDVNNKKNSLDKIIQANLHPENKEYILEKIVKHKIFKAVWLAEIKMKYKGDAPVYMLLYKIRWFNGFSSKKPDPVGILLNEFTNAPLKENPIYIFSIEYSPLFYKRFSKKVKEQGVRIL
jgi:Zn-dependent protease with chaperone function